MPNQDKLNALADGIDGLTRRVDALVSQKRGRSDADLSGVTKSSRLFDRKDADRPSAAAMMSSRAAEASETASSPKEHVAAAKLHEAAGRAHNRLYENSDAKKNSYHYDARVHHEDAAQMHRQAADSHPSTAFGKTPHGAEEHGGYIQAAKQSAKDAHHWSKNPEGAVERYNRRQMLGG